MISNSQSFSPLPMDQQATDFEQLNNLYVLQSILQGMLLNIDLIESGTIGQILTVTNANLFQIAAQQYGDPNQWTVIAGANDLSDPMIEPTITLTAMQNQLIISGIAESPQTLYFNLNLIEFPTRIFNFVYYVQPSDTLASIASNIVNNVVRAGSFISNQIGNQITYTVSFNNATVVTLPPIPVERVISLVIPQQTGTPSGGVPSN